MGVTLIKIVLVQFCLIKLSTSQMQPVRQYVVSGLPSQSLQNMAALGLTSLPYSSIKTVPASSLSAYSNVPTQKPCQQPEVALSQFKLPGSLLPASLKGKLAKDSKSKAPGAIDSNVLNNLAIALQLLIMSNMMNSQSSENAGAENDALQDMYETLTSMTGSKSDAGKPKIPFEITELFKPERSSNSPVSQSISTVYKTCDQKNLYETLPYQSSMPNSKFLTSSGFSESSFGQIPPSSYSPFGPQQFPPRTSMTLMSPYEALGPNSPYSDPILSSSYGHSSYKNDFQSPYSAILDDGKDFFPMNGLFR